MLSWFKNVVFFYFAYTYYFFLSQEPFYKEQNAKPDKKKEGKWVLFVVQ